MSDILEIFNQTTGLWEDYPVLQGKSAYQSYLDTTKDNPKKTEAEWVQYQKGRPGIVVANEGESVDPDVQVRVIKNGIPFMIGADNISPGSVTEDKLSADLITKIANGGLAGGVAPSNMVSITVTASTNNVKIKFTDPADADWVGTKVVMKTGSYPSNENDGTLILNSKVRNAYSTTEFIQSGLTNSITYYFGFFPYSTKAVHKYDAANRANATPFPYKIMTATIDLANSNPATCITYSDDAAAKAAGAAAWDTFFDIKPCLFKDGAVVGYLNPNDFSKFVNGTAADITSGAAGDVMIEFPKRGLSIATSGTSIIVKMTDNPSDPNFKYYAHTSGTTVKDKFYLGAYKATTLSSKLRSLSGKVPIVSQTLGAFRTAAQANGANYGVFSLYQIFYLQSMYVLKYKTLDSQTAIGKGYVAGAAWDGTFRGINTGGTETWGMNCESVKVSNPTYMTDGVHHVKLFGIEDLWGNIWDQLDGILTNAAGEFLVSMGPFNDSGTGYTNLGLPIAIGTGYSSKVIGNSLGGFFSKEYSGSATTYFCDAGENRVSSSCVFGGYWLQSTGGGIFCYAIASPMPSGSGVNTGTRLLYL